MHLVRDLCRAKGPTVVTIGSFDGVHLGHAALLERVVSRAKALGTVATAITFEPLPAEFFRREEAPFRITRLREKVAVLERLGLEQLLVLPFGRIAKMEAERFIHEVLVEGLGVQELFVGDDFRFGYRRRGEFELLRESGRRFGFRVERSGTLLLEEGFRISSSAIRKALLAGELELACRMLGRRYSVCGRVVAGDRLGRRLGFPTANLHLGRWPPPLSGVFAVQVAGLSERLWPGVANVGLRPTVGGRRRPVVEVHLLDFEGELYGRRLEVFFCKRLRPEQRFPSLSALREQIERDIEEARASFQ